MILKGMFLKVFLSLQFLNS